MPLRDPDMPSKDISQPHTESTSSLRSPEDNLSLWQFMTVSWMTPLIRVGNKRQLQDEDVWQLGYEFQHRRLHENFRQLKGTVVQRLVQANGIDLIILTVLGILELVANFAVPVLLQQILAAMEDPSAPKTAAIRYAALSLAIRLAATQSGVFSLWFGRRCYERSRGEMITMLYEKTLGRKISFQSQEKENDSDQTDGTTNADAPEPDVTTKRAPAWWTKTMQRLGSLFSKAKAVPTAKEPASMGKILNLMRNDVYEVAQRFWEFQSLITKPLSCVFSIVLVVRFLGWPSLIAVLALILAQLLNAGLARIMIHFEKKRRAATDSKLQVISQFVEAIRHLR
ncbi:ABC bile acid transporter, partial [Hortaea werneckii]